MKTHIVIPSNRDLHNFETGWSETDITKYPIILVEDRKEKTIKHPAGLDIIHYSHADIEKEMGKDAWIISKGDSSIKSFGMLMAQRQGADAILCLDDDVTSIQPNFVGVHNQFLNMEILSDYKGIKNMVRKQQIQDVLQKGLPKKSHIQKAVVMSYGLWYGYLDVYAERIEKFGMVSGNLSQTMEEEIREGEWASISGMNVAVKAEALPAYYQLLMGKEYGIGKWGDVWSGLFFQRICYHLDKAIMLGYPLVFHQHEGDNEIAVEMERGGYALNERLWEDVPKMELTGRTFRQCYLEIAEQLPEYPENPKYMTKLKEAMQVWANLF